MRDYTQIIAWQRADDLTVAIYRSTRVFPREELYGLTSQLRRAAYSVAANIAEGSSRETKRVPSLPPHRTRFAFRNAVFRPFVLPFGVSQISGSGRASHADPKNVREPPRADRSRWERSLNFLQRS